MVLQTDTMNIVFLTIAIVTITSSITIQLSKNYTAHSKLYLVYKNAWRIVIMFTVDYGIYSIGLSGVDHYGER